jgi:hypothetical protein
MRLLFDTDKELPIRDKMFALFAACGDADF